MIRELIFILSYSVMLARAVCNLKETNEGQRQFKLDGKRKKNNNVGEVVDWKRKWKYCKVRQKC